MGCQGLGHHAAHGVTQHVRLGEEGLGLGRRERCDEGSRGSGQVFDAGFLAGLQEVGAPNARIVEGDHGAAHRGHQILEQAGGPLVLRAAQAMQQDEGPAGQGDGFRRVDHVIAVVYTPYNKASKRRYNHTFYSLWCLRNP